MQYNRLASVSQSLGPDIGEGQNEAAAEAMMINESRCAYIVRTRMYASVLCGLISTKSFLRLHLRYTLDKRLRNSMGSDNEYGLALFSLTSFGKVTASVANFAFFLPCHAL